MQEQTKDKEGVVCRFKKEEEEEWREAEWEDPAFYMSGRRTAVLEPEYHVGHEAVLQHGRSESCR